jgi:hypothetical protein
MMLGVVLGVVGPSTADAATIQVLYNIEGSWTAGPTRAVQCIRVGTEATCILVNQGLSHRINLVYTSPTRLEGLVTRRNRANSCVTHMRWEVTMTSANAYTARWTALDSSCDLVAGQSATDPQYTRVL